MFEFPRIRYGAEVEATIIFSTQTGCQDAHLPFLLPSRYSQSDQLGRFAGQKFGSIKDAYDQVLKVMKWIHDNVEYVPGTTTSVTSAYDTVTQCSGVCRDFARLGNALCRALTIPARYFAGYAHLLNPPDFHASVEAFLGAAIFGAGFSRKTIMPSPKPSWAKRRSPLI